MISDCDVDAADLHLILDPQIKARGDFSGGVAAEIEQDKCTGCGRCKEECRFSAVKEEIIDDRSHFFIDYLACEGCGVCYLVCKDNAVKTVIASLTGATYALVVTEPTVSGIHDLHRILKVTSHFGIPSGIVVNKYDLNMNMTEKIKFLSQDYNAEFVGIIPYDKKNNRGSNEGTLCC